MLCFGDKKLGNEESEKGDDKKLIIAHTVNKSINLGIQVLLKIFFVSAGSCLVVQKVVHNWHDILYTGH